MCFETAVGAQSSDRNGCVQRDMDVTMKDNDPARSLASSLLCVNLRRGSNGGGWGVSDLENFSTETESCVVRRSATTCNTHAILLQHNSGALLHMQAMT